MRRIVQLSEDYAEQIVLNGHPDFRKYQAGYLAGYVKAVEECWRIARSYDKDIFKENCSEHVAKEIEELRK